MLKTYVYILATLCLIPCFLTAQTRSGDLLAGTGIVSGTTNINLASDRYPASYSMADFYDDRIHRKWCGAHKGGLITMGVGGTLCIGGAVMAFAGLGSNSNNGGAYFVYGLLVAVVGDAVFWVGTGVFIGGVIHDHRNRRISLIAPKSNEVGLAYNF